MFITRRLTITLAVSLLASFGTAAQSTITKRNGKVGGPTRVDLAPQVVFERGGERVTFSAYYDPEESRRRLNDPEMPVLVNLEFTFTPAKAAPADDADAKVVYLINGRRERPQPAVVRRRVVGTTVEDRVSVLSDVSVEMLKRMAGARRLEVQVAGRNLTFGEAVVARLAELSGAIGK